jgi:hypothetical protein
MRQEVWGFGDLGCEGWRGMKNHAKITERVA